MTPDPETLTVDDIQRMIADGEDVHIVGHAVKQMQSPEFGMKELNVLLDDFRKRDRECYQKHGMSLLEYGYQQRQKRRSTWHYRLRRWIVERLGGVMDESY